jgi:hypothetical protein
MNKIHRVLWSRCRHQFVVVAETAKTRGKGSTLSDGSAGRSGFLDGALLRPIYAALLAAGLLTPLWPMQAQAQAPAVSQLPVGGHLAAGQASIAQSGSSMAISRLAELPMLRGGWLPSAS